MEDLKNVACIVFFCNFAGLKWKCYMKKLRFVFVLLIAMFFISCGEKNEVREIVFVTTNDIHGRINEFNELQSVVSMLRGSGDSVLLVNAGDMFSGNPYVDMSAERGQPMIEMMNLVGYSVTAIGNHEFDYGQSVLAKRIDQAKFPFLCANMELQNGNDTLKKVKPYSIIEINGIKVCFLSVLYIRSNGEPETYGRNRLNIKFNDPVATATSYRYLRDSCDVFVGLTHLGVGSDTLLAKAMPELDLIIGGHSHTLLSEPLVVNGVVITQTGSTMKNIGVIRVKVKNEKVIGINDAMFTLTNKNIRETLNGIEFDNLWMKKGIGTLTEALDGKEALGKFMTDAIRWKTGVDAAFQNQGGVRLVYLPAGEISIFDLYSLDPFGNDILIHEMTLNELKELILWKYNEPASNNESHHIKDLFSSGIDYTVVTDGEGNGIDVDFFKDGEELDSDINEIYTVALNNYVSTIYEFSDKNKGTSFGMTTVDMAIEYVKNKKLNIEKGVKKDK